MKTANSKTVLWTTIGFAIIAALSIYLGTAVRSIVVRAHDDRIVFIKRVTDRDAVILSHTNSMYDARVDEHLEIRGDVMVLADVLTDSHGVREYYGIADGIPHREWSMLRVFSTVDRAFALTVRGVRVDAFQALPDTHFSISLQRLPRFRLALMKLHLFV